MKLMPSRAIFLLAALPLAAQTIDYARQIHPILLSRCVACHNANTPQGGVELTSYTGVLKTVTPGRSATSNLMARITGEKPPRMPLGGASLSDAEIARVRLWIEQGAQGPKPGEISNWKPSLALSKPALPDSPEPHPVDKIVFSYFRAKSIAPPAEATPALQVRRAYLDLWGLLPPPGARANLDTLLANRRNYSGHWISFWNDLLRNDEGVVYHGERKSITPWLRKALEENLPYDLFVQALLNPVDKSDPDGYLTGVNWRGDVSASQIPVMQAAQNSAQVFLGVNLKCNSCHDSFISRWKLKDAYGLAAFFATEPLAIHRCDIPVGEFAQARFLYPELGGAGPDDTPAAKRAAAARLFTMPENGRTPRTLVNRIWKQLFGRGLVEPVDDMDAEPWSPELLDWLAADFVEHRYDLHHLLRTIMSSKTYRLASTNEAPPVPYVFKGPLPRRLSAEQFGDAVSTLTGEWRQIEPKAPGTARYARDWQLKSTPLGRALGRPIRDQVFTERQTLPTTFDALELVNGATLAGLLRRGAQRLTGELRGAPASLFDSGILGNQKMKVDVDVTGVSQLFLVLQNVDSYDASRVLAGWSDALFSGPGGDVPLSEVLGVKTEPRTFKGDAAPLAAVPVKTPQSLAADLSGRGFTRFRAFVGVDESCLQSDISPRIRFFVFPGQPSEGHYYRVEGEPPLPLPRAERDHALLADRLYRQALGRAITPAEARVAAGMNAEDLLWSILLSPEFQYIR